MSCDIDYFMELGYCSEECSSSYLESLVQEFSDFYNSLNDHQKGRVLYFCSVMEDSNLAKDYLQELLFSSIDRRKNENQDRICK